MTTATPSVSSSGPAPNEGARLYYETYVLQDPTWNLVASGWLDTTESASQAYGVGAMIAAQYNLPTATRVWDQDALPPSWSAWTSSTPASATPPAASTSGNTAGGIAAGIGALGLLAVLTYAATR